jgi:hypothetical protein
MKIATAGFWLIGVLLACRTAEAADWFLAGREGNCLPLSILAKLGADLRDVKSPYDLAEKMRAAGHPAEIKEYNAGSRPAVEVRVPSRHVDVMFLKADLCNKTGALKR